MAVFRAAFLALFPLLATLSAACGSPGTSGTGGSTTSSSSSSAAGGDGAEGNPSDTYPAPFPAPPQVVTSGGPLLASPKIVPVFFSGDDAATVAQIQDFVAQIGQSPYWKAAVSEYGVGAAAAEPAVMLSETAPATIDDSALQTWLAGKLDGDDPAWPAADGDTVYVLHYPAGTTITVDTLGTSCTDFGGYHASTPLDASHGSINVAYAVIPRCPALGDRSVLDVLTSTESHELVESSTDPYPQAAPAYVSVDVPHLYWSEQIGGGEIADMCAIFDGVFTKFPGLDYVVQRVWSNKAALAGGDPCVPPLAGEVYVNAGPELGDVTTTIEGQSVSEKGVQIPVGGSKTILLDLYSDASTGGPFSVQVDDGQQILGGSPLLSFVVGDGRTISCGMGVPSNVTCVSGENGQKVPVTITVKAAGTGQQETFWVASNLLGSTTQYFWIGLVTN